MNNCNYILTIITVTKNCSSTIERTLASIRKINKNNIEYIVIDGCSSDGTYELIQKNNDIIDELLVEQDGGIYEAMNKGVMIAKGKFVLFINGDDEIISDNFDDFIKVLRSTHASVVSGITLVEKNDGSFSDFVSRPMYLLKLCSVPHPSSAVLRSLVNKYPFREDLRIASDYDLFLKIFLRLKRFQCVDIPIARLYRGGISSDLELNFAEVQFVRQSNLKFMYNVLEFVWQIYRKLKIFVS